MVYCIINLACSLLGEFFDTKIQKTKIHYSMKKTKVDW